MSEPNMCSPAQMKYTPQIGGKPIFGESQPIWIGVPQYSILYPIGANTRLGPPQQQSQQDRD
jgi:hypothetical protein